MRPMSLRYLDDDTIDWVIQIVMDRRLVEPGVRTLLFNGLPSGYQAALDVDPSPQVQLRLDLTAMNSMPPLSDGIPLAIWLSNAARLLRDRSAPEGDQFEAYADQVRAARTPFPAPAAGQVAQRRALLVGVATHPAPLRPLRTPKANLAGLGAALATGVTPFEVTPQLDPAAADLRKAVERHFAKAQPDALLLFYFVGRALLSPDGSLYLCAADTDPELLDSTGVPFSWIHKMTNRTRALQVILVFDCVFEPQYADELPALEIAAVLKNELGGGKGKYLIVSSSALGEALETPEDELSLFTAGLADGLEEGRADTNGDGVIHVAEWFHFADAKLRARFADRRPQGWAFDVDPNKMELKRLIDETGTPLPLASDRVDFEGGVYEDLMNQACVPILGAAIHGSGPLSHFAIGRAMAERAGLSNVEEVGVVTAAEYLDKLWNRHGFLRALGEILEQQTPIAPETATHQLLGRLSTPLLVISATYDSVLEASWAEARLPHVIVTHVQSAAEGQVTDGVIAIRPLLDGPERVTLTDATTLLLRDQQERVIYKPLGAPFLNRLLEEAHPDYEIDTVVATESDYVAFVGRLQHQKTSVPAAFARVFRRRSFLFLGYPMDSWHYRLITRIIDFSRSTTVRAVRQPTSPIEELSWKRLPADLIPADPEAFSRAVLRRMITEAPG